MPVNDNCDTKDKSERVEKQYITKVFVSSGILYTDNHSEK